MLKCKSNANLKFEAFFGDQTLNQALIDILQMKV